jgi:hypothetical protein
MTDAYDIPGVRATVHGHVVVAINVLVKAAESRPAVAKGRWLIIHGASARFWSCDVNFLYFSSLQR